MLILTLFKNNTGFLLTPKLHFDTLNSSIEVALQIECIFGVVISSRSDQSGESKEDIVLEEKDL
jgi:hypothetical protein